MATRSTPTPIKLDPINKTPVERIYYPTSSNVAVRDYFESKGYKVDYDSKTGNIRIYDPKTGSSSMALKGSYALNDNKAYVTPEVAKQIEDTISSGKYKLPTYNSGSSTARVKSSSGSAQPLAGTSAGGQTSQLSTNDISESIATAVSAALRNLQSQYQYPTIEYPQIPTLSLPQLELPQIPTVPTVQTPAETIQSDVPVTGIEETETTQQETASSKPTTGSSGFMLRTGALLTNPEVTAKGLYDYYKKLTGNESTDENVIPQIQSALQGAIPAWMVADPVWRLVLIRGGINPSQLRLEAIRERLNNEEG